MEQGFVRECVCVCLCVCVCVWGGRVILSITIATKTVREYY